MINFCMLISEDWGKQGSYARTAIAAHFAESKILEDACARSRRETTVLLASDPPPHLPTR